MTATVTRPAEDEATTRASATLARVKAAEWSGRREEFSRAYEGLEQALETHAAVLNKREHHASAYPECPEFEHGDDAYERALAYGAEAIGDWCAYLDELIMAAAAAGDGEQS
jgi:Tfp pilus assembly protein PilF